MENPYIVIFCTLPSETEAEKIATHLVDKRLAACCNIISGLRSIYRWQNRIESDDEVLLIIKSEEKRYREIEQCILEMHSYEVPEILAVPVSRGSQPYLNWISDSISG